MHRGERGPGAVDIAAMDIGRQPIPAIPTQVLRHHCAIGKEQRKVDRSWRGTCQRDPACLDGRC